MFLDTRTLTHTLTRCRFDALVKYGLKPHHKILELGCGSLRSAVWTIAYLDAGNYFCIESNAESLRAGLENKTTAGVQRLITCLFLGAFSRSLSLSLYAFERAAQTSIRGRQKRPL